MNKEISVYDNTVSARTYISYIAEQAGGFACIGRDGKLYIKQIGQDIAELPLRYFENFEWGEKIKISRIRYEDGIQLFEPGDTTGNTIYINQENMYIVDEEQIDNIYNIYKDFEVYSFEGSSIIDPALDIGDLLLVDGKYLIYQGSGQFGGKFKANISSKIQCKAREETMSRTPSQKVINRRVQSEINQADAKITQLVQETTEHEEKLTQAVQDVQKFKYSVNNSGGNNLIKNSVGWANLDFWEVEEDSNIVTNKSDEIVKNSLSKSAFQLNNGIMKQSFEVELNKSYSVGFKIKKPTIGSGYVQIIGDTVLHVFNFETGTAIDYESYNYTFTANTQVITVEIYSDCGMIITDLIANTGDILSQWQPYAQELYALGVQIDSNGIKTYDNISEQEVLLTPTGLTGKYKDKEVFKLNGDITETEKISAREEIDMNPIKIIAVSDGWDFVYVD